MTIEEMHYDFKKKLNKVDSQENRNLLIPEIDWVLNEALTIFISNNASPKTKSYSGFEKTQRNIDDIYPLVIRDKSIPVTNNKVILPEDYMFYISSEVLANKDECSDKCRVIIQQQDDRFEEDPFTKSSFEWREVNAIFTNEGIQLFSNNFTNEVLLLSYIKKHPYVCYPLGFTDEGYMLPSGKILNENVNCILPEHTHSLIVDIAVAITSGEIGLPETQLKFQKLQLNQFT